MEDDGDGICFCVYCFNIQPGITIDYVTGDSHLSSDIIETTPKKIKKKNKIVYIAKSGKGTKYHSCAKCRYLNNNSSAITEKRAEKIGYTKCLACG